MRLIGQVSHLIADERATCMLAVRVRRSPAQRLQAGVALGKRVNAGDKRGPPASQPSTPRITLNILGQGPMIA